MIPKPRVESDVDEIVLRDFGGRLIRRDLSVRWLVYCPCHLDATYAIAAVPSWEAALEIALHHGRTRH